MVLGLEIPDASPIGPLGVGVYIHLNYAVRDRLFDVVEL